MNIIRWVLQVIGLFFVIVLCLYLLGVPAVQGVGSFALLAALVVGGIDGWLQFKKYREGWDG